MTLSVLPPEMDNLQHNSICHTYICIVLQLVGPFGPIAGVVVIGNPSRRISDHCFPITDPQYDAVPVMHTCQCNVVQNLWSLQAQEIASLYCANTSLPLYCSFSTLISFTQNKIIFHRIKLFLNALLF